MDHYKVTIPLLEGPDNFRDWSSSMGLFLKKLQCRLEFEVAEPAYVEGLTTETTIFSLAKSLPAPWASWTTNVAFMHRISIFAHLQTWLHFIKVKGKKVRQYCRTQKETVDLAIKHVAESSQSWRC